jgi:hypothetical protein
MANEEVEEISITQSYSDSERVSVHSGTSSYELPHRRRRVPFLNCAAVIRVFRDFGIFFTFPFGLRSPVRQAIDADAN